MVNQTKLPATEEFQSTLEKTKSKNGVVDMTNSGILENKNNVKEKWQLKTSLFVKLNMDGIPIGRKVDLNAHNYYETLAQTLEDMFCRPITTIRVRRPSMEAHNIRTEATGPPSKLLDGSSEFVTEMEIGCLLAMFLWEGQSDTIVEDIENMVRSYVEKVRNLSWQEQ